ncbi:MAG: GNAT family N-acetyltransferase [Candidatus Thermoplasmatota archaeon]|nr:GNAT family N-acetyltransferase [Candidatus Thermoplasmatota archaeon]
MVSTVELPDIIISTASIQHLDEAVRCWHSLVIDQKNHDERISTESLSDSEQRQFLRSVILDGRLIVALDSSRLIGISTIAIDNNMLDKSQTVWNISDVWVDFEYRRRGVGIQLVNECEKQAKYKGASEIRLQVYSTNQPASMMYGRLGYRTISRMMTKKLD